MPPGVTAGEVINVIGPQIKDLRDSVSVQFKEFRDEFQKFCDESRTDRRRQSEEIARQGVRLDNLEKAIAKATNGNKAPDIIPPTLPPLLSLIFSWMFRFMVAGGVLAAGVNLGRLIDLAFK